MRCSFQLIGYSFDKEMTFKVHVVFIATSNTPSKIVMKISLTNSNVFGAAYRLRQDLYTNIYAVKFSLNESTKNTK